jgi:hypothetical protein
VQAGGGKVDAVAARHEVAGGQSAFGERIGERAAHLALFDRSPADDGGVRKLAELDVGAGELAAQGIGLLVP